MLVVVHCGAKANTTQEFAFQIIFAFRINSRLFKVDSHRRLFFHWFLGQRRFLFMMMSGNAVLAVEGAERNAKETTVTDKRDSEGASVGLAICVLDHTECLFLAFCALTAAFGFLEIPENLRFGVTRNFDVIRRANEVISIEGYGPRSKMRAKCSIAITDGGIGAKRECRAEWISKGLLDETTINDIDEAASGSASIEQRGRSADDFDTVRQQSLDGSLMVLAERGSI